MIDDDASCPSISGRAPTSSAAATAAPEEMPPGMPSSRASARGGVEGGLVADRDDLVDHRAVEDVRHEAGADALDLVRAGLAAGQHRAILGLDGDDLAAPACAASAPGRRR